jgi:hypothetical protein
MAAEFTELFGGYYITGLASANKKRLPTTQSKSKYSNKTQTKLLSPKKTLKSYSTKHFSDNTNDESPTVEKVNVSAKSRSPKRRSPKRRSPKRRSPKKIKSPRKTVLSRKRNTRLASKSLHAKKVESPGNRFIGLKKKTVARKK